MRTMSMQENVLGEALAFARRVTSAQIDTAVLLNLGSQSPYFVLTLLHSCLLASSSVSIPLTRYPFFSQRLILTILRSEGKSYKEIACKWSELCAVVCLHRQISDDSANGSRQGLSTSRWCASSHRFTCQAFQSASLEASSCCSTCGQPKQEPVQEP